MDAILFILYSEEIIEILKSKIDISGTSSRFSWVVWLKIFRIR